MKTVRCVLKPGKEKPVLNRHPWIFSGAIDSIDEGYEAGDLVYVLSCREEFLGVGYLDPESQIAVRMLAFEDVAIDGAFFAGKIREAAGHRRKFLPPQTTAYRLIHSEGDFLSGLIVDVYGDFLIVQFLTAGMDVRKDMIVNALRENFPQHSIYEKSDGEVRKREGLQASSGVLAGSEPPAAIDILENGLGFGVDIRGGQKTGFFLDQRDNRAMVRDLSAGRRALNCFAYTGGFSVYAAKGGAVEVVSVDSSATAVALGKKNCGKNGFDEAMCPWAERDVFDYLREEKREFDLIILDPPAFCKNKQQIQQAARGYKDINLQALKRLSQGGLLFTFSCSSHITPDLFQKIVFGAAADAGRDVRILRKTAHAFDHPVNIFHPEGEYLKGLLCEVS
ncbi:MAG TPA: class I SAM-dependent rRNA methyltransferase [Candidatus Omnitrophota bacterium]|nr:class I SAM-dependent rRNA methyltransferase [Candidatus Omnitrophota bacterium]HPS37768.1 class I SAM-dependent rRNA methyltransferase [Candidatus Omnitrophota bacterium]